MAITTINDLTEVQSAGANDVLPISTASGVKKIKASAIGGSGGDATADLTLVAVAAGVETSGSYNDQAVTSFTSFTLTVNKDFDSLLSKARTKRLALDGSISWQSEMGTQIAEVDLLDQTVIPKEMASVLGITTNKDFIYVSLSSIYKRGSEPGENLDLYLRFVPALRVIYEDTNGTMQIIDPSQGG